MDIQQIAQQLFKLEIALAANYEKQEKCLLN